MTPAALDTLQQHLLTALANAPDEVRRLFHGRGHRWPGLESITVDWLQGVLLVTLFRQPAEAELADLKQRLLALAESAAWRERNGQKLLLQHRYRADSASEFLLGEPVDHWPVSEHGLRFKLDLGRNQNSGLFLDMRYGRRWVQQQAQGKRVLNLFAYTCAFSVAAIAGGALHVLNLDMAKGPLTRGRDNHRLNGHDLGKVGFLGHDLFKSWGKISKCGPYDLIIVDPPSFQKGSFVLTQDYRKVLRRLPGLLSEQGQVLACLNDPAIGADFLLEGMAAEAPGLVFQRRLDNPPEFADSFPGGGLKVLVFHQGSTDQNP
ncbi:MAG: class I SAM-dependent methyltransferase [Pseudomonas sp.]|uniref:class I SAM-dependent methyltransferase n=1 Tax=Pseudomonas sp. TaxID=306 RepID=UPI003393EAD1